MDSFIVGLVMGMLLTCFLMLVIGQPKVCEVSVSMGKETHVRYGVVIGGM